MTGKALDKTANKKKFKFPLRYFAAPQLLARSLARYNIQMEHFTLFVDKTRREKQKQKKSLNLLQSSRNKTFRHIFCASTITPLEKLSERKPREELLTITPGEIIKKFVQIIKHKLCIFMEIKALRQRDTFNCWSFCEGKLFNSCCRLACSAFLFSSIRRTVSSFNDPSRGDNL